MNTGILHSYTFAKNLLIRFLRFSGEGSGEGRSKQPGVKWTQAMAIRYCDQAMLCVIALNARVLLGIQTLEVFWCHKIREMSSDKMPFDLFSVFFLNWTKWMIDSRRSSLEIGHKDSGLVQAGCECAQAHTHIYTYNRVKLQFLGIASYCIYWHWNTSGNIACQQLKNNTKTTFPIKNLYFCNKRVDKPPTIVTHIHHLSPQLTVCAWVCTLCCCSEQISTSTPFLF